MLNETIVARTGSTRRKPVLLLWIAALLMLARIGTGIYENRSHDQSAGLVKWVPITEAESVASKTNKPLLYDFTAEWCGPCQSMEKDVYAHKKTAEWINQNFVPVKVLDRLHEEGKNPPDVQQLEDRFNVEAFPTLVVVSGKLREPEILEGYESRQSLVKSLSEVLSKTAK